MRGERLEASCYELLASEARAAAFVAIAKGDVPQESWLHLGRAHVLVKGERVLLSWSGTMFEYLMPALWMRNYPNTILEQSLRAAVRCQQAAGKKEQRPWGISEAASSQRDAAGHYQYRAFGLPALGIRPAASDDDRVVSPYATFLALAVDAPGAVNNLRANNSNAPQLPGLREKLAAGLGLAAAAQPQGTVAEFAIDVVPEPTVEAPPPPPPPPAPKPVAAPPPPKPVPVVEAPKPAPVAAAAAAAPAKPAPPKPEKKKDALADFVLELDESLGEDFAVAAAPPAAKPAPAAARPSASASTAKAAASAAAPKAAPAPAPISAADASATLSDMFAEFKEDVEEGADQAEDPDTHYNLGVAFKEMGLLDEAIGELQKVCHAIEKGHPFSQVMQAYTWLAHCFLEKGAPEASVKWYEKALHVPSIDEESKMAVYYELGSAHEAAGNKKAALASFNEVYSNNIDYRDVAERIKALRS